MERAREPDPVRVDLKNRIVHLFTISTDLPWLRARKLVIVSAEIKGLKPWELCRQQNCLGQARNQRSSDCIRYIGQLSSSEPEVASEVLVPDNQVQVTIHRGTLPID